MARITIDYPADGSIFPPEIPAPAFVWHDAAENAAAWLVEITFAGGEPGIRQRVRGERLRIGEIDPRSVADTNEVPKLTPYQAAAWSWQPDAETWAAIKKHSMERPATVTITGFPNAGSNQPLSRGQVTIRTSKDPVGAPIFYRDVPLMPSELEKGVIKPLVPSAVPLIAWRLRNVAESRSRLLMEGLPTCANCHSFSLDGKTLGMDLDGPQNDKSLYALARITPHMSIGNEDVVAWNFPRKQGERPSRIGFMSQVSPDGRYVVTTVNGAEYVANFKDYRFLQVFYQTRGVLAWYSREAGRMQTLPGADDPRYVHTNAVWTPDGKYLIFGRAKAKEPYPEGRKMAQFAGDPNEVSIQYDLYRIPFNEGRGGRPEPIPGASRNGMSNSFPKVSPDGRWIVFVKCRNGLLMRPDSELYIIPAGGGQARRLRANALPMNSWHSFSPNGRWLVFASKRHSPYTQMFLTHLDEQGNDSPAIRIENATAANRAVNIPEFLNVPPDGLVKIDVPAAESYGLFDRAWALAQKGDDEAAIAGWKKVLAINPRDAKAHNNLGVSLSRKGRFDEAVPHFEKALEINPEYQEVHTNLGRALIELGRFDQAIGHFRKVLEANARQPEAHNSLGVALMREGKIGEAIVHWEKAIELDDAFVQAHYNLGNALYYLRGDARQALTHWRKVLSLEPDHLPVLNQAAWVLATSPKASLRNSAEAIQFAQRARQLTAGREPAVLDTLAAAYAEAGRFPEAVESARQALALARQQGKRPLAEALQGRLALYEARTPCRQTQQALAPRP